ncbi:MAG: hypothetical protein ACI9O6_000696 [Glaciecola sp.]|jgi:hypothetical protein|mmetsp:Transcript_48333/g.154769  ORF Transcript_48333/g.154769 Transcript_48333/m.154769 type:complete len:330 (-) Transcript_48333:764-1753(-)
MNKLLLCGGQQKYKHENEWSGYQNGKALILDLNDLSVENCINYRSPSEALPESKEASVLFKAASSMKNNLETMLCTQTEILKLSNVERKILSSVSLSVFNDVHHVFQLSNNYLAVVSTGLDAVFVINEEGVIQESYSVLSDKSIWERFDKQIDYRKYLTTKPHAAHPNFGFEYNNEIWVSRFNQKDIFNVNTGKSINIGVGNPHDGILKGDTSYLTTTNGNIVLINMITMSVERCFNIRELYETSKTIGWCRSIYVIDEKKFIVGFSRIRPTKFEQNLLWLKRKITDGYQGSLPTRIACFDFDKKNIEWELDLEKYDMNAIFSITDFMY